MADSSRVTSKTELLKTQAHEQFKQHIIYDISDRTLFVFSAKVDAKQGDPCLVVEYTYIGTSSVADNMQERVSEVGWQTVWESKFVFDPNTVYDSDGDGRL